MDEPKRTSDGQVIQDQLIPNEQVVTSDPGNKLGVQFIDGKSGSVNTLQMVQTDFTEVKHGGSIDGKA